MEHGGRQLGGGKHAVRELQPRLDPQERTRQGDEHHGARLRRNEPIQLRRDVVMNVAQSRTVPSPVLACVAHPQE